MTSLEKQAADFVEGFTILQIIYTFRRFGKKDHVVLPFVDCDMDSEQITLIAESHVIEVGKNNITPDY
jgi:hypothetical protein